MYIFLLPSPTFYFDVLFYIFTFTLLLFIVVITTFTNFFFTYTALFDCDFLFSVDYFFSIYTITFSISFSIGLALLNTKKNLVFFQLLLTEKFISSF